MKNRWKRTRIVWISFALIPVAMMCVGTSAVWAGTDQADRHAPPSLASSRVGERVVEIPLADGQTQRALLALPVHARGAVVMLPGGAGDVGIERDGDLRHGHNFVVRTRTMWNRRGYAVLIPDTIDRANLRGVRSSPGYARLVDELILYAGQKIGRPVFLLGTSQGAIAAMNGAAHAPPGSLAGVVLTESVSVRGGSGETVFDADPGAVRVPALIVANRDDHCKVAPPQAAQRIAAAMTVSPSVQVMTVAGGITRSGNLCGSLTPHGYDGIEEQVVAGISAWMDAHAR